MGFIFEVLLDLIFIGLFENFFDLFKGKKKYKFLVTEYKDGKKYRISSIYFEAKKKYQIRIEELKNGKFKKHLFGIYTNEDPIVDFCDNVLIKHKIHYNQYEYDKMKLSELKDTLDSIGWYKKEA